LPRHAVEILPNIPADPTAASVQDVIDAVKNGRADWIIAMGGGSVLDTAKAAAVLSENPGDVVKYLRGELQVEHPGVPLIAVPTTAGSGSEVTPFASITDSQKMSKISLTHDHLYPKFALLDPSLTLSLTRRQTAVSGMDALSHAIEGFWSNRATSVTDSYALAAAKLMLSTLPNAYRSSDDIDARRLAMEGSMLAGLTISNARTTAVHAVSYPMTVHFHIPHGLACAMLLPPLIRYNAGAMNGDKEERLVGYLGLSSMEQLAEAVGDLQQQMDLPVRLRDLGLRKAHIATIVDNGFRPDRMNNNPRQISAEQLSSLLETIL
jgi:alcohol dehydrogenase class IV